MALLARLLKVGSMTEALGVYVPAMIFQKALGLGRVVLFAYLLAQAQDQYGLWGLGMLIVAVGGPVATLGANHGLIRYVSVYEAGGRLRFFYQLVRWRILGCAIGVTALGFAFSGLITRWVIVSGSESPGVAGSQPLWVCWAALGNVLVLALYYNMLSILIGLRAYRAVSAVEVLFSIIFTIVGPAVLIFSPGAVALLAGHLVSVLVALAAGAVLTDLAVRRLTRGETAAPPGQPEPTQLLPPGEAEELAGRPPVEPKHVGPALLAPKGAFAQMLRFGFAAMVGNLLWLVVQNISLVLTNRHFDNASAGVFRFFMQISQAVFFLASAAWAVIFPHVVKRWEGPHRDVAASTLETAYKAVAMALMGLTVIIYAASPVWIRAMPREFRHGQALLGGLLMFFQVLSHLALMTMIAKLQERPLMIAVAAVAGGIANLLLAWWWMPLADYGPAGAAWAAGVGMYVGAGAVAAIYLLRCRLKLHAGTYLVMASPILLLLPAWLAGAIWAGVLGVTVWTSWVFDAKQKRLLSGSMGRILRRLRRAGS